MRVFEEQVKWERAVSFSQTLEEAIVKLPKTGPHFGRDDESCLRELDKLLVKLPGEVEERYQQLLREKGYIIHTLQVMNRHRVRKMRYVQNFEAFSKNTQENAKALKMLRLLVSHFSFDSSIELFDIGCADGAYAKEVVEILKESQVKISCYSGVDLNKDYISKAFKTMGDVLPQESIRIFEGRFRDDDLTQYPKADWILLMHLCYYYESYEHLFSRLEQVKKSSDSLIILDHSVRSPLSDELEKMDFLRSNTHFQTGNKICNFLKEKGYNYEVMEYDAPLSFPQLKPEEWQALHKIEELDYGNKYLEQSENFHEAKRIIEFLIRDPLEAFEPDKKRMIVELFFREAGANNHQFRMKNNLIFTLSMNCSDRAKEQLQKTVTKVKSSL